MPFLRCGKNDYVRKGEMSGMDDEERILSCQQEIFRLRGVVRYLEADARWYEQKLMEEMEKESMESPGLQRALEIWKEMKAEG